MKQAVKQFGKDIVTVWTWFLIGLRWLTVVVFSLLFAIGLFFELPWKILACLAVIPVVGIFVPQKRQAWVWLALVLIITAAWIWVMLPGADSSQWTAYRYQPGYAETMPSQTLAPADNAAIYYESLLNKVGESIFYHPYLDESAETAISNNAWQQEEYPDLAQWIQRQQPRIERLLTITQMPECRFPTPLDLTDRDIQLKRLNQMKAWAKLLIWSANLDLGRALPDRALQKQLALLDMVQHLYQQQTLLDHSAAFQIELMAFRSLCTFSVEYCDNPQTLETIERAFEQIDTGWAKSWHTIVNHEKLIVKNILGLFYEVDPAGNTRIAHSAMFALQEGLGYTPRKLFLRQHEMNRLAVIGLWLSLPVSPETTAELIDQRFDYYSLIAQKGAALPAIPIQYSWRMGLNIRSLIDWFAMNQVRYFWALHGQYQRHQSLVELIRIFSALKQYRLEHRTWPDNLTTLIASPSNFTLIDPVYGKSFMYRRTADGFCLYGQGPNGEDDNGVNDPINNKDDIVFWPRMNLEHNLDDSVIVRQAAGPLESK